MYCTMKFYFNLVSSISSNQLRETLKEINEICHTEYKRYEIILDSPFTTNSIYSKIKKCDQIDEYDERLINDVLYDKTDLMKTLYLENYNDSDRGCERIRIRFHGLGIKMISSASVSYRVNNCNQSMLYDYKKILQVFYGIGWRVDNSLACCYKSPNFPWALDGVYYNFFNGKKTRKAIEQERKHFHRNYVGSIQDVYQANTIMVNHISEEKLKILEEICGEGLVKIADNYFFDCLKQNNSFEIDKEKRRKLRDFFDI